MGFKDLIPIVREEQVPAPRDEDYGRWSDEHPQRRAPVRHQDQNNPDIQAMYEATLRATHEAGYQKGRADSLEKQGREHVGQMFQLAKDLIARPAQRTLHQTWNRPAKKPRPKEGRAGWWLLCAVVAVISLLAVMGMAKEFLTPAAPMAAAPAATSPNSTTIYINPIQPQVGRRPNSY